MKIRLKYIAIISCLSLFVLQNALNAQSPADTLFVTGMVTDAATQEAIQGARIQAGKMYSAITNETGHYKVRLPYKNSMLEISAIGYLQRFVTTRGSQVKNVSVYKSSFVSPKNNPNAYSSTDALTLEDELQSRYGSDIRVVKRSGEQGIGSNLFIRGYNSLNANAKPLIIVDGVIWDDLTNVSSIQNGYFINPLLDIDVNDIESIEVMKNASSLYGSKAANGALIIKTNRGKSQATKITFDAMTGIIQKPQQIPVMNAAQYRTYVTDVLKESDFSEARINNLLFLQDDPTSLSYNKYHNDTQWGDQVYSNGISNRYAVSVQGGDEVAMYGFSMAYTGVNGVMNETTMDRLNTRFNSDINLSKSVNVATNISFSQIDRELRDDGVDARTAPGFLSLIKSPLFNGYKYTTVTGVLTDKLEGVDDLGVSNPLSIINNGIGQHKQYRFNISAEPVWDISKHIKISSLFGYSINKVKEHYFLPVNGVSAANLENYGMSYNVVKDQTMQQISVFNDTKFKYENTFADVHKLDFLLGFRMLSNRFESDYGEGHNTGGDYITNLLSSLAYKKVNGLNDVWNSKSVYAQASYSYAQRYSLWVVSSVDHSSRFGDNTKDGFRIGNDTWAVFPSVGVEWLVTGESFMKNMTFIDKLKLHSSFGLTGNDDIGNNAQRAYLQSVNYMDKAVGLKIANLNNPTLQWETTQKLDAGIDIAFLNERVNLSATVFSHKTQNLLTLKQNSMASGLGSYWTNEGELRNTGYELALGLKLINLKSFKWNMNISAAHYGNKITALPDGDYTTIICNAEILSSVGNPAGLFYGYKSLGVFASNEDALSAYNGVGLKMQNVNGTYSSFGAGDIHFDDKDGNGIINEKDKQIIGNPNPDFTGAAFNTFSFNNFTLDVVFTYSLGNDIYNFQRSQLESMSNFYNQSTAVVNRWIANGQETSIPKAIYGDPVGNGRFSDRWIEDGSYLKLQNIKLSYVIPIKSSFIDGLTVWTSVNNLVTFTGYLGGDPENSMNQSVLYQGIDYGLVSSGRIFNFGLKLNL